MNLTLKNTTVMDEMDIEKLTLRFFDLFTNTNGRTPNVQDIKVIFIAEGIIINNTSGRPIIYSLEEFIEPREKMLSDGTLTDFIEKELSHKTEIFENIAQRFSRYKKSGKRDGIAFKSEGMKSIQFIKIENEWKMAGVAWSDKE